MSVFENIENLEVSEACFNDIIDIVEAILSEAEGIMPLMKKHKGDKKKAIKEWVKQRNQELKDAGKTFAEANRLKNNAFKSYKRGDMSVSNRDGDYSIEPFYDKQGQTHTDYLNKYKTNLRANYSDVEGVRGKMDLPPLTPDSFKEQNKKKK